MWTKTFRSGTNDYRAPRDLYIALLSKLVDADHGGGWVHFELEKRVSRLERLFSKMEDMVEVALDPDGFELNPGSNDFPVPPKWHIEKRWNSTAEFKVPLSERPELLLWIEQYFERHLKSNPTYTIRAWLDGI